MANFIPSQEAEYLACRIANGEQGLLDMSELLDVARSIYIMEQHKKPEEAGTKVFHHLVKEIVRYSQYGRVSPGAECKPYKIGAFFKEMKNDGSKG